MLTDSMVFLRVPLVPLLGCFQKSSILDVLTKNLQFRCIKEAPKGGLVGHLRRFKGHRKI